MTAPDKKLFEDWFQFIAAEDEAVPQYGYQQDNLSGFCLIGFRKAAESFVDAIIDYAQKSDARRFRQPLYKWLMKNGFGKISARAYRRRLHNIINEVDYRNILIQRLYKPSEPLHCFRVAERVRERYSPSNLWSTKFIEIYFNYLNSDHEAIERAKKTYYTNLEKIQALIEEINPYLISASKSTRSMERALEYLRHAGPDPRANHRSSKHKAEHYFVQGMYKINLDFFGKPKPEVISDLMALPGFGHQFDARHVARLCSGIRKANLRRKEEEIAMAKERQKAQKFAMTHS